MSEIVCTYCMHQCHLKEGETGWCRARRNVKGINTCDNYGRVTSLALDPIEKKPFADFCPGSMILSVGSYGCNLGCPFCQNAGISMQNEKTADFRTFTAEELCSIVMQYPKSIGLAFTYNEPLISWEWILDCAKILKPQGKKIVLVTNGEISKEVLDQLLPYTDAMNIDLKGDRQYYRNELYGDYDLVHRNIAYCAARTHVEVTTLIIPGKNDSEDWIAEEADYLASIDPDLCWHLSRYFPHYRYTIPETENETIFCLQAIAEKKLSHVIPGNIW